LRTWTESLSEEVYLVDLMNGRYAEGEEEDGERERSGKRDEEVRTSDRPQADMVN